MKQTIKNAYKFSELSKSAQEAAIRNHIRNEIKLVEDEHNAFWDALIEMDKLQTIIVPENILTDPVLREIAIDDIEDFEAEFTEDGKRI